MIKTIYFDIGNVLIFFSFPKLISQVSSCSGLNPKQTQQLFFETDLRKQYETGLINTKHLYELFLTQAPKQFSFETFILAFSDIFIPNTELFHLIEEVKNKGIRLILLSNTSECHFRFLQERYPILELFDQKILSFEQGIWKPDQEIFQRALSHAQCGPKECFYTDDVPEFIESARKIGLPGEIFINTATLKQQLSSIGCITA